MALFITVYPPTWGRGFRLVCLFGGRRSKRKTAAAISTKVGRRIYSPWHDLSMHWHWGQKVKFQILTLAAWRESACRYDCTFLYIVVSYYVYVWGLGIWQQDLSVHEMKSNKTEISMIRWNDGCGSVWWLWRVDRVALDVWSMKMALKCCRTMEVDVIRCDIWGRTGGLMLKDKL